MSAIFDLVIDLRDEARSASLERLRENRPTPRVAVQLCKNYSGKAELFVERAGNLYCVLARHCVGDQ